MSDAGLKILKSILDMFYGMVMNAKHRSVFAPGRFVPFSRERLCGQADNKGIFEAVFF